MKKEDENISLQMNGNQSPYEIALNQMKYRLHEVCEMIAQFYIQLKQVSFGETFENEFIPQLIEKIKSLRQYIQQNDELLNNILSILVDQSGGYIGVTQMNKHQQRLCSGIIQFISIICSHMIIDSMDYKKVFIMTTILQPTK